MQLVLIKDDCRQLGISCATSLRVSIASRIVVREGLVAAELASGSAPSRCPEPHCPTVLPLGVTEWQADRALGATEWRGRAPRVSPGGVSGKVTTRRPSWREGACGLPADKAPPYRPEKASLAHP